MHFWGFGVLGFWGAAATRALRTAGHAGAGRSGGGTAVARQPRGPGHPAAPGA